MKSSSVERLRSSFYLLFPMYHLKNAVNTAESAFRRTKTVPERLPTKGETMKEKFIPKEKLGKKARRELDRRGRAEWSFSPVNRVVESKKLYSRKKKSRDRIGEYGSGISFFAVYQPNLAMDSGRGPSV